MKYKYRLVEQEETPVGDSTSKDMVTYDFVLTPLSGTVIEAAEAFEKISNYGLYISNLINSDANVKKAFEEYFGPSQPWDKKRIEKERGKPFPPKSKSAIDTFIKTTTTKPKILRWKIVGDTLVFPTAGNPTKKITEKIIDTVMRSAKIKYGLETIENQGSINEQTKSLFNWNPDLAFKVYDILKAEFPEIENQHTKSSFFYLINNKL